MDDLISRQAAIDKVDRIVKVNHLNPDMVWFTPNGVKTLMGDLPSAQPEVIRCKDCKHKYIENEVWACPFGLAGGPDFYCGYGAEGRSDE